MKRFEQQTAIVTGGTEGIGLMCAQSLAREGASVVICNRSTNGQDVENQLRDEGAEVSWFQADVSNADDCAKLVDACISKYGSIDILINNAGNRPISLETDILNLSDDELAYSLQTNVHGPFNLIKNIWPYFEKEKYGRILNFCSGHVFGSSRDFGTIPIAIAKSATIGLTKTFASAGAPLGIHVNTIFPAALDTAWNRTGWDNITCEEETTLANICSKDKLWPLISWLCSRDLHCSGEFFSACNENITRVSLIDTENASLHEFDEVGECIKFLLSKEEYYTPRSIGHFFGNHLGLKRSKLLHRFLTRSTVSTPHN